MEINLIAMASTCLHPTSGLQPGEVWSFVFESNSSAIEPRCSYGAQAWELAAGTVTRILHAR